MITRRQFLKSAGLCGLSLALPPFMLKQHVQAALPDTIQYVAPAMIPQIIHIFLYGGPSELAGNLTNIAEIANNSQNPYPASLNPNIANNDITTNKFWGNAGGQRTMMEVDIDERGDLSVVRPLVDPARLGDYTLSWHYVVTGDGSVIARLSDPDSGVVAQLNLILDWSRELTERVPID